QAASCRKSSQLARPFVASPVSAGNDLVLYHEGHPAFAAMLNAIVSPKHHVHLETFIFRPDATGFRFLEALTARARQGVEVGLLYDAMGTHRLQRGVLRSLRQAGGRVSVFLPLNILRRRLQ